MKNKFIYLSRISRLPIPVLLFLLFAFAASSQSPDWQWANAVGATGEEAGQSIAVDASGNVYSTGYFEGTVDFDPGPGTSYLSATGNKDVYLTKSDSSGQLFWAKRIGGTSLTESYSIALDDSGNIYMTGRFQGTVDFDPDTSTFNITFSGGSYDMFISRLSNSGNFVWTKVIQGSATLAYTIAVDAAGNVYTAGVFAGAADFDPGSGIDNLSAISWDIFISKLDASGNYSWAKRIGGNNYDYANSIAIDNAAGGALYITGAFEGRVDFDPGADTTFLNGSSGSSAAFIFKMDSAGNFVWAREIAGIGGHSGNSIAVTSSGSRGVYTLGTFTGTTDFDPGAAVYNLVSAGVNDVFISRLDSAGNFVWAKAMGGSNFNFGHSIAVAHDGSGSIFASGDFNDTADFDPGTGIFNLISLGATDIFITKMDSMGAFLWAKAAGGTETESCKSMVLGAFSDVYIQGDFSSPSFAFGSHSIVNANASGSESDIYLARLGHLLTGIEILDPSTDVSVFPNPFTDEIVLQIKNPHIGTKAGTVILFNSLGKEILRRQMEHGDVVIKTGPLAPGLYTVRYWNEHFSMTRKVIKYQ